MNFRGTSRLVLFDPIKKAPEDSETFGIARRRRDLQIILMGGLGLPLIEDRNWPNFFASKMRDYA